MSKFEQLKFSADKTVWGIVVGLVIPVVILFVLYLLNDNDNSFIEFATSISILKELLRACIFANLILIFIFNVLKMFLFCRGVFFSSLPYVLLMFYLKFFA